METQVNGIKKTLSTQLLIELICYLYILLFIYAGIYKLMDIPLFAEQLKRSPLLGSFAGILTFVVPLSEVAIALGLMVARTRLIALYLATGLMLAFTLYIIYLLNFSPELPCSCGGILATMGWRDHLWLNAGFVVIGVLGVFLERKKCAQRS